MADVRDEELAKLIGLNITNRLIAFDRTQQDLADYLGASKSTVSMWVNGKRTPLMRTIDQICKYFGCTREDIMRDNREGYHKHSVSIPVYARVAAGLPLEAAEDIIDREEIPEAMAEQGPHFAVRIWGDSMEPRMKKGDVVIVRKQTTADDGDIVIVTINGTDATCKRFRKYADGIALISNNPAYPPMYYTAQEVEQLPVCIIGKVVELRAKM
jgi:repressor LexA